MNSGREPQTDVEGATSKNQAKTEENQAHGVRDNLCLTCDGNHIHVPCESVDTKHIERDTPEIAKVVNESWREHNYNWLSPISYIR